MNPLYVVLIINLVIWTGVFLYVNKTDRDVKELKRALDAFKMNETSGKE
jgi:CcmD family protein